MPKSCDTCRNCQYILRRNGVDKAYCEYVSHSKMMLLTEAEKCNHYLLAEKFYLEAEDD